MKYSTVLIACALAGVSAPAVAKQCPSGQILRVSKGVCMDKAEAIKSGVIASHDANPTREARLTERQASPAGIGSSNEESVVAKTLPPEPPQRNAGVVEALGYAAQPTDQIAPSRASPYGALKLDYFGPR